ncbi:cobalt ECF transporter T component CbiQ [Ferviditalea candida]|uniref:Cobalt ECF transporter T component CbiQ n=1 Tax=Ferviditalea candida TaxID=3108399 RepID=A0ABU5ZLJ1_9BACL|nr:cobalt ECF transporter T component CbiQ [Paenibacillaceae bacterium T2]
MKGLAIDVQERHGRTLKLGSPRMRMLTVFLLLAATVAVSSIEVLAVEALLLALALLWIGIPFRYLVSRTLLILPFGLGSLMFLPFTRQGEALFVIWGFAATKAGAIHAGIILMKMVCANLLITFLLSTTPLFELIKSLRTLGVPAVLIEMTAMMMRYFFLLTEDAGSMIKAQKSRGLSNEGWLWSRSTYRRFGQLLGVLFIRSYGRSWRIYNAIFARGGYDGGIASGKKVTAERGSSRMIMEVKQAEYRYGDIAALKGVNLQIPTGGKVALMGPNGAGKSTLISLLNGLEQPHRGEIYFKGTRIGRGQLNEIRQKVGVVYQDPDDQIFSATVEEDVAFGPSNMGLPKEEVEERVQMALGSVGMREYRKRSPFELSYGQKRRVAIAGVLAMRPEVIILDEPMAYLDPKGRDELQSLLEALHLMGITIIVATHDVDFAAEWAETVILLKDGEVLASGTADLLFEDRWIHAADLHLPRLARPFRMIRGLREEARPRTVRQAAQIIWRMMMNRDYFVNGSDAGERAENEKKRRDI